MSLETQQSKGVTRQDMGLLRLFAWIVMIFGGVLCLAGFTQTLMPVDLLYAVYHPGPAAPVWGDHLRFSTSLMGAVTLGWGLTLRAVVKLTPDMSRATAGALWKTVTTGMIIWFVVDSILSVANGFWVNAVSNTVLGAVYLFALNRSGLRTS